MSCETCTRHNQNMNTPNLMFAQESYQGNVSIHADYPMFQQVSQEQFNALAREIGATNSRVARNEVNLIKMGKDMTKIGQDNTWFGKKITTLDRLHGEQESRITEGFDHRTNIETKIDNAVLEHEDFHKKFTDIGIVLNEAKADRDRLNLKIDTAKAVDDIIPDVPAIFPDISKTALLLGAVGIGAFLLMRK